MRYIFLCYVGNWRVAGELKIKYECFSWRKKTANFHIHFICWIDFFSFGLVWFRFVLFRCAEWVEHTIFSNRQENCYVFCISLVTAGDRFYVLLYVCLCVKTIKNDFHLVGIRVSRLWSNQHLQMWTSQLAKSLKWNNFFFFFFCLSCASVRAIIKLAWEIVLVKLCFQMNKNNNNNNKLEERQKQNTQHNYSSTLI